MSVREFSPLFSWGFSLRRSKWLIPLFNNNVFSFGTSAVNDGPYGYKKSNNNRREKSTSTINHKESHTMLKTKVEGSDLFETPIQVVTEIGNNTCSVRITHEDSEDIKQKELEQRRREQEEIKRKELERYRQLSDGAIIDLIEGGKLAIYNLEDKLGDKKRAVKIRRMFLASKINPQDENLLDNLPYAHDLNYDQVFGACCESVVGYVPLPVGIVGPIIIDGKPYHIPMATVEGCLVASTHRGCKALSSSFEGGVNSVILSDGMTRGPVVQFANTKRCNELKQFIDNPENFKELCRVFNSDSRFARLLEVKVGIAGRKAFLRFKCRTGDAMGMNMISKATQKALKFLKNEHFQDMDILSLSGNYCTDKKPSAMNWIEGRGKSVVVDATIPKDVVKNVLKTTVDEIVSLNISKNLIGSAMAGSVGGFNAHAANIVTAIFLATGQDAAQNVESSNCMTIMEKTDNGDLYVSVTMPSIEVGTVGGGTHLDAQKTCLKIIGVAGANQENPGQNAQTLAKCVASTVMAGELSLMAALAADHLVSAHIAHNRKK
ncbi:3-hydroxy-3-methylglutaryl-CoA (HMG-CoA) reductase [Naegleria gruberi]|uniref:3-hydroxy-3-methylglutaryl coenzyme A reductase n=2 Tax=Naegleria gruberi TaxID=5762 RepID=D2VYB1_NAEGR|nr:3-hydroxy-3-methylglutaryl-CoA (HMG-CoA) reductase [Naegleria gruberi]EFC38170.1 3-hydroxy-3-methylglutaryl-CoA (HMG-CoA) reductase [Naegleria gruberi]|eukprot:XP_002670914.1 3-hydroxy-3-methylglutaryl-CoA (HMG-CoA) reductase [Naegleria gruberi strain NEG-M]